MIEKQASVIAVEQGFVVLQARRASTCGNCASKSGCSSSSLDSNQGRAGPEIRLATTLNIGVGDTVVLGINEWALIKGVLLLYLFPLLAMLIGGIVGDYGSRVFGIDHELFTITLGIAGLTGAVAVTRYSTFFRLFQQGIEPVILSGDIIDRRKD